MADLRALSRGELSLRTFLKAAMAAAAASIAGDGGSVEAGLTVSLYAYEQKARLDLSFLHYSKYLSSSAAH
jgi:hypothetical protein